MMIGGSFLASLPKGFFNWPMCMDDLGETSISVIVNEGGADRRKRRRQDADLGDTAAGSRTPTLVSPARRISCGGVKNAEDNNKRPLKRFRGHSKIVVVPQPASAHNRKIQQKGSEFLSKVPEDVVAHCLSFLGTVQDRYALQTTCKLFRDLSNSDPMLAQVNLGGERDTGEFGIILESDTPATAAAALAPFARAGNLEALYMLGIVKCYCYQDLKNGILMLKMASSNGYVRSSYTLGIILRDALPDEASQYMDKAAKKGYLPALQEVLPAREMKEKFGEPNADELRRHLDPMCLNRLLLRDYVESAELRGLNTSHCWNPLCGKWAYKATNANAAVRMRRPWGFAFDAFDGDAGPIVDLALVPATGGRSLVSLVDRSAVVVSERNTALHAASSGAAAEAEAASPDAATATPQSFHALAWREGDIKVDRVSRMKMCSRCCRAKYCSKLCQVYDWRSSQHKMECQFL